MICYNNIIANKGKLVNKVDLCNTTLVFERVSLFNERTLYSIPNNTGYVRTVPMGNSYSATSITRAYLDKVDQLGYTKMAIHSKKVSCQ